MGSTAGFDTAAGVFAALGTDGLCCSATARSVLFAIVPSPPLVGGMGATAAFIVRDGTSCFSASSLSK